MRNRWGVEIKRGNWVMATGPRGGRVEGRIVSIDRSSDMAKAYGPRLTLDTGQTIGADDVSQTLGPMTVDAGGVVKQNPKRANPLTRVKVGSRSQRPHQTSDGGMSTAPTKRLKTRRRKTAATKTRGVYANPARSKVGIKVNAGNNSSGNPRKGWLVFDIAGDRPELIHFIDHGYTGERALIDRHGDIPVIGEFTITAGQYRDFKRAGVGDG